MELSLDNVINISVSQTPSGISAFNTSNLALFTSEEPVGSWPADGYKIYFEPTEVATDFGTSSRTYDMANKVFSQQPNILAGGGYLVVIKRNAESQSVIFDAVAVSGTYKLNFGGNATANIDYDATPAEIQTALRLVEGLESVVVTGAAQDFEVAFNGVTGDISLMTVTENTMVDVGSAAVTPDIAEVDAGETLAEAITRTAGLVQYFGVMSSIIESETDMLAAAAVIQPLVKIGFFVQRDAGSIEEGGSLDLLRQNGYSKSRGLFYGSSSDATALAMQASYAGRALSVNFNGSNTTSTMHLKDIVGVTADSTMNQTLLNKAIAAGADTYVNIQGVAKVFCFGENTFFDSVYNLWWFVAALQVNGFNYLAQSSTKVPQTEAGMDGLKGAYRKICEQAVTNSYCAPGSWTNPTTFGVQEDLYQNVAQLGYYIYSAPVAQQLQTARAAREAPLVQIALKEAGAIHSSDVVINVNA